MLPIGVELGWVDQGLAALVVPLACWILISGLDDVFLDTVCALAWLTRRVLDRPEDFEADETEAFGCPAKRIAILVPLWQEDGVIRQMVENNINRIEYLSYDFFLGAYPNDDATLEVLRELETRYPQVHLAVCPHPGPTSKADCLNWIYQNMIAFEREKEIRFEVIVTHDAEDVIHPHALHWLNYYCGAYDMVQVPVLPLPTPGMHFTHGIYCDEFAEFQTKDMPGRQLLGGFIPSNGVGTGFSRWALDQLANRGGRIFEPECLTEDYENGLRLHLLGCPQIFMPLRSRDGEPVATREYFPRTRSAAIRQRTRWVTGIALQSWERHGWQGGIGTLYWLWRDRKGLVGNFVSMLTSVLFAYGLVTWIWSRYGGTAWGLDYLGNSPAVLALLSVTSALQVLHVGVRMWCSARVYGWRFAAGVPLRVLWGNYINFRATFGAIWRFTSSRLRGKPLVWLKTDHSYPTPAEATHRRRLGEILVRMGLISDGELDRALALKHPHQRIGEYLTESRLVSEENLYEALSLQSGLPFIRLEPHRIPANVARALPVHMVRESRVVPMRISGGYLTLASPETDSGQLAEVQRFTRLKLRLQLVTFSNYLELVDVLSGAKPMQRLAAAATPFTPSRDFLLG